MDKAIAGFCRAGYVRAGQLSTLLDDALTNLEKNCKIKHVSENVCESGMDTIASPLIEALNNLEKR